MATESSPSPEAIAFVMERGDPEGLVSLATRMLAATAFDQEVHVLFRLGGHVWARPCRAWPATSPDLVQWLRHQEFRDLGSYWRMTVETVRPDLAICSSSLSAYALTLPDDWAESSLVGFLAAARETGREVSFLT